MLASSVTSAWPKTPNRSALQSQTLSCGAGPTARAEMPRRRGTTAGRPSPLHSLAMLDLEAYLERIGLSGPPRNSTAQPSLTEVHRAHVCAIPFENLDPRRGVPVSLELADLERKLVHARRGGYCFEQNLLLKAGLEALGAQVELVLARVRYGRPPGRTSPRTHLVLRVRAGSRDWHADAGFGNGTLLEPIPFGPG